MIMVNLYGTKGSLICGPAVDMNLASRINDLLYESDRSNYQLVYKNWTAGKNDIAKRMKTGQDEGIRKWLWTVSFAKEHYRQQADALLSELMKSNQKN